MNNNTFLSLMVNYLRLLSRQLLLLIIIITAASRIFAGNEEVPWQPETIIIKFQEDSRIFTELKTLFITKQKTVLSPYEQNDRDWIKSFEMENGIFLHDTYEFFKSYPLRSIESLIPSKLSVITKQGLERIFLLKLKDKSSITAIIDDLNKMGEIEYAEPDFLGYGGGKPSWSEEFYDVYSPKTTPPVNDANFHLQYGLLNTGQVIGGVTGIPGADINIVSGWEITSGSSDIILGVLDSGLPSDHFEFQGRITSGESFVPGNPSYYDDHGHGTSVASIAAATGNNSGLMAGTDWNCKIMPVKILNNQNSGFYSWWINGITYATDQGAHVLNMSVGGSSFSSALQDAVNYALANDVIVVACMMNANNNDTYYPAGYEGVIAVGATNNRDERAEPFSWGGGSNYGNHIDFAAPGDRIASLGGANFQEIWYWSGTSMASPFVAATITLMLSIDPDLSRDLVHEILMETTRPQITGKSTLEEWNQFTGWGRIDVTAALELTLAGTLPSASEHLSSLTGKPVKIFPNPAADRLNVEVSQGITSLQLIDLSGRIIEELQFPESMQTFNIDVSGFKSGLYLIRFIGSNLNVTEKLVVRKP